MEISGLFLTFQFEYSVETGSRPMDSNASLLDTNYKKSLSSTKGQKSQKVRPASEGRSSMSVVSNL